MKLVLPQNLVHILKILNDENVEIVLYNYGLKLMCVHSRRWIGEIKREKEKSRRA